MMCNNKPYICLYANLMHPLVTLSFKGPYQSSCSLFSLKLQFSETCNYLRIPMLVLQEKIVISPACCACRTILKMWNLRFKAQKTRKRS